jgi:GNAT superfamily N-acetyltransferase
MDELRFREATIDDVGFLVTASKAAERLPTGGDGMYQRVYGLTNEEVDRFFTETLAQDTKDNQLTFRTFNVLVRGAQRVGCCSAWVEAQSGQPNGLKVAMAVSRFLGAERWRGRSTSSAVLAKCAPKRTPGALQLETFYVVPEDRGKGLTARLIQGVVKRFSDAERPPPLAEISLLRENQAAAAAYAKSGFEPGWSTADTDEQFLALTGSRGFLQMRRVLP